MTSGEPMELIISCVLDLSTLKFILNEKIGLDEEIFLHQGLEALKEAFLLG